MNWETVFASAEPLGRREHADGYPTSPAGDTAAPVTSSQSSIPPQGPERLKEEGQRGHPTPPWKSTGGHPAP